MAAWFEKASSSWDDQFGCLGKGRPPWPCKHFEDVLRRITAKWRKSRYWCCSNFTPAQDEGRTTNTLTSEKDRYQKEWAITNSVTIFYRLSTLQMTKDFVGWLFRLTKKLTPKLVASHYELDCKVIITWNRFGKEAQSEHHSDTEELSF